MFKKLLVATDGSSQAQKAVEMAGNIAEKYDADLTILYVTLPEQPSSELRQMAESEHLIDFMKTKQPPLDNLPARMVFASNIDGQTTNHELIKILANRIVEQAATVARQSGAQKVTTMLGEGDVAGEILDAAEKIDAEMIVIGCRGQGALKRLFLGSVSSEVAQLAKCPCLTVR